MKQLTNDKTRIGWTSATSCRWPAGLCTRKDRSSAARASEFWTPWRLYVFWRLASNGIIISYAYCRWCSFPNMYLYIDCYLSVFSDGQFWCKLEFWELLTVTGLNLYCHIPSSMEYRYMIDSTIFYPSLTGKIGTQQALANATTASR